MEEWKEIDGWSGYKISTFGRVMSYKKYDYGKLLSQATYKKRGGYKYIALGNSTMKTQKKYKIHRLVGEAFIPNPDNLPQIDHIDRNTANNNISNLRWVTARENMCNTSFYRTDITETDPKKRKRQTDSEYRKRKEDSGKYECECGSRCRHTNKSNHFKSKKHQDYLTKLNISPTTN